MSQNWELNKVVDSTLSCVEESQRQKLERIKKQMTSKIEDIDRALQLLTLHPEVEELSDLLRRI